MCIEKCLRSIEFNKSISKLMCSTTVAATAIASVLGHDIYHTFVSHAQHRMQYAIKWRKRQPTYRMMLLFIFFEDQSMLVICHSNKYCTASCFATETGSFGVTIGTSVTRKIEFHTRYHSIEINMNNLLGSPRLC